MLAPLVGRYLSAKSLIVTLSERPASLGFSKLHPQGKPRPSYLDRHRFRVYFSHREAFHRTPQNVTLPLAALDPERSRLPRDFSIPSTTVSLKG
jgi:hypothetical protein